MKLIDHELRGVKIIYEERLSLVAVLKTKQVTGKELHPCRFSYHLGASCNLRS